MSYRFNLAVPDEDRWRFETFTDKGGSMQVELFSPNSDEYLQFSSQFKLHTHEADWDGALRFMAEKFFRDFVGAEGPEGPIENTLENRVAILKANRSLFDLVFMKIREAPGIENGKN